MRPESPSNSSKSDMVLRSIVSLPYDTGLFGSPQACVNDEERAIRIMQSILKRRLSDAGMLYARQPPFGNNIGGSIVR